MISYKYGEIEAAATFFWLYPVYVQKTERDLKEEILSKFPGSSFHLTQGCQLHGDIDGILTLPNGDVITIPWNY
jgi:hypothetical protein